MTEILKNGGNNNYKLPHIGKKKIENLGQLLTQITTSRDLVQNILNGRQNAAIQEPTTQKAVIHEPVEEWNMIWM